MQTSFHRSYLMGRNVSLARKVQSLATRRNFRAAVLLHGCGVYDGTEVTEGNALLVALSKQKAQVQCFAPDRDQMHVVNHLTGEEETNPRNVMAESARIARGNVKPLDELKSGDFDALFIPGGFGAAKNLSDFGVKGGDMAVKDDVVGVVKDFHAAQKYMGLCCIAPVIAAKVLGTASGGPGTTLTMGGKGSEAEWPHQGAIDAAASFGNSMVETDVDGVVVDAANRIVTAPAYMKGTASSAEVYDSVKQMVDTVSQHLRESPGSSLSLPISILVTVEIEPDRIDDFKKALSVNAVKSRLEEGCYRFDVLQDRENPNKFTFYEVYEDSAAIDAHKQTKHYDGWAQLKASGAVVSQSVQKWRGLFFGF